LSLQELHGYRKLIQDNAVPDIPAAVREFNLRFSYSRRIQPGRIWRHSKGVSKTLLKVREKAGRWWLRPVILATQEAEIRRIMVRSQPRQIIHRTPS
jgi:hypothetical protein